MNLRLLPALGFFLVPAVLLAQPAPHGYIVFKDGTTINGRVIVEKKLDSDSASGVVFVIPNPDGFTYLDDDVRRIYFPPGQIAQTVPIKLSEANKDQIMLTLPEIRHSKGLLMPAWRFDKVVPFDKNWYREIEVVNALNHFSMKQKVVYLSPRRMRIQSPTHNWEINYFTKERDIGEVTKLVKDYLDVRKDFVKFTPEDKNFVLAKFNQQMGRYGDAEKIAKDVLAKAPEHKKKIDEFFDLIEREKAAKFGVEFEPLAAAKQHRTILEKIAVYDKGNYIDKVAEKTKLLVTDLKNRYEADKEKLEKARGLFKFLMSKAPEPRGFWLETTTTILDELNYDTLPRLDTFLAFAEQYQRDITQDKTPNQKLENVMALAVSGWHLGNIAAEPDVKLAQTLWNSRKFVRDYMKTDTPGQRNRLAEEWAKESGLPIDVAARLLQHLPPPNAYLRPTAEMITLDLDLPDAPAGSYLIQLPPDYNHQRPHPVLMMIHGDREGPDVLLGRWAYLAAQNGFILVAPKWKNFSKKGYAATDAEQTYFMNVLKDVKRRFQVDTDRVFLFGWSNGAEVAWDVGLSHPHQFAGLLPMCGMPNPFSKKYWQNAQNLGLYIVDGDKSGQGPATIRELFKSWIRFNYNAYFLEYKGRANELYLGEFEPMMEWMSRKKRQYPARNLGTYAATSTAVAEEFRTFRQSDDRFYWLSTDEINDNNKQDAYNWVANRNPAMLQGTITVSNASNSKGDARIETLVSLQLRGVKHCTVWLAPSMIDFTKSVQVRINGKYVFDTPRVVAPSISTMLEEYYQNVDRQRLYYAKLDLKVLAVR